MNPVKPNTQVACTEALEQTDRVQGEQARDKAHENHQAALYRGRTTFAYAHRAHAKALANKLHASKMQARRTRANKQTRFAAPRKALAQPSHQPGARAASLRAAAQRIAGQRVSRDGGRSGRGGSGGDQSSSQQGQGGSKQGQGQERRDSGSVRRTMAASAGAGTAAEAAPTLARLLDIVAGQDTGGVRGETLANAHCDALLLLREELAASPGQRFDARLHRLSQEVTAARVWLAGSHAVDTPAATLLPTGFSAIRARLIERATQRSPAQSAAAPINAARLREFNLLLGLHLLIHERPLLASRMGHSESVLASLEAGSGSKTDTHPGAANVSVNATTEPTPR
ncbi:hypothetical protein [Caballeronia mineralivorans]|jgi:hypothetical protein|uniref:hypothetical protein n=1 Tax=Caballeronia mineralivorans TaxID=2010198 RepID=UPI0023F2B532|nr:hypothetical protein [Caballeronia mineralivorans]MDB5787014.1 hypothetical protein [Caballeronia mineralivorans]MEA3098919.1 type secretion regulatory protein HpaA [Caballeronia mineralivorans]